MFVAIGICNWKPKENYIEFGVREPFLCPPQVSCKGLEGERKESRTLSGTVKFPVLVQNKERDLWFLDQ